MPVEKNKKKIAIIYGSLQDIHIGAPGHIIIETLKHLPNPEIFDWIVLYNSSHVVREEINSINVDGIPFNFFDNLIARLIGLFPYRQKRKVFVTTRFEYIRYYVTLIRTLKRIKPDMVVVHVAYPLPWLIKRFLPATKVLFYHHGSTLHLKLTPAQWKKLVKSTEGIIAVSKAAFEETAKVFALKARNEWVVHNGSSLRVRDLQEQSGIRQSIRKKLGLEEKTVFIYCGRMVSSKGIVPLVRAFDRLQAEVPSVSLLLVGDANVGQDERDAENAIQYVKERLSKGNGVILTGWVAREKVAAYVTAADIAVLPSLMPEGISIFAIDSLALGKPLIATDMGGNREVSLTERSGLLISGNKDDVEEELHKAMKRLVMDENLRRVCEQGAMELSRCKFNVEAMSVSFFQILLKLNLA